MQGPGLPVARRVSDAERDEVLHVLGEAVSDGRLSHDTFLARLDAALASRDEVALSAVVADLARRSTSRPRLTLKGHWWSRRPERPRRASFPTLALPTRSAPFLSLGRSSVSDVQVDDPTVSGVHAGLLLFSGSWFVVDRGSTNGTFVNEHRVREVAPVAAGDLLGLGCATLRLTAPRGAAGLDASLQCARRPGGALTTRRSRRRPG